MSIHVPTTAPVLALLLVCACSADETKASAPAAGAPTPPPAEAPRTTAQPVAPAVAGLSGEDLRVWEEAQANNGLAALDGRAFAVEIGEMDKPADRDEVLEFAGGRLHSRNGDGHGFGSGAYDTRQEGEGLSFHAVCANAEGANNDWHGVVTGTTVEGGFTWSRPGEPPVEYWFRGTETQR